MTDQQKYEMQFLQAMQSSDAKDLAVCKELGQVLQPIFAAFYFATHKGVAIEFKPVLTPVDGEVVDSILEGFQVRTHMLNQWQSVALVEGCDDRAAGV